MLTVREFIQTIPDSVLLKVYKETSSGIVPRDGYAHELCKAINTKIDQGTLRVEHFSYRSIYLPTLKKFVEGELARRYAKSESHDKLQSAEG